MWRGLLWQWHVRGYRQDYSQPGLGLTGAQDRCIWHTLNIVFKIKWLSFKIARDAISCSGIHRCFLASITFKEMVPAAGSLSYYKDTVMQVSCSHWSLHEKMNLKINKVWRAIIHPAFEHSIKAHFPPSNVFYLHPSRLLFLWDKLALGKDGRSPLKKIATKLQSHDATLPVVTSAPLFHLSLLLGGSCHIRRRIGGSFPPPSPPFPPFQ